MNFKQALDRTGIAAITAIVSYVGYVVVDMSKSVGELNTNVAVIASQIQDAKGKQEHMQAQIDALTTSVRTLGE